MAAMIGSAMMVGGVFNAGIMSANTTQKSCENAKNALDLLRKQKQLSDQWSALFASSAGITQELIDDLHATNNEIDTIQNKMQKNLYIIKKSKKTISITVIVIVVAVFFLLLIKYFFKQKSRNFM